MIEQSPLTALFRLRALEGEPDPADQKGSKGGDTGRSATAMGECVELNVGGIVERKREQRVLRRRARSVTGEEKSTRGD